MTVEHQTYDPCAAVVVWYVWFCDEPVPMCPWFVRLLLGRGWRHVRAMRDYKGVTLIVDHVAQGLLIDISAVPVHECLRALGAGANVVTFAGQLKPRYTQRGIQSCVSVVKSLLGIKAWHIITPNQLYRYLLANGGQCSG